MSRAIRFSARPFWALEATKPFTASWTPCLPRLRSRRSAILYIFTPRCRSSFQRCWESSNPEQVLNKPPGKPGLWSRCASQFQDVWQLRLSNGTTPAPACADRPRTCQMTEPRRLLQRLLETVEEQAQEIDPRQFSLNNAKGFIRRSTEIAGLPGVEYDIKVEGDHIWLRVARFTPTDAPVVPDQFRTFIRAVNDPDGSPPLLDDAAFRRWLNKTAEGKSPDRRAELEKQGRATVGKALHEYAALWNSWANEERPRRKTIVLYGDLFSLRHQLAAEETTRQLELVWGIGSATRKLEFERSEFDFEYPILTQASEIALDEMTMSLEIRPRATDTRVELDAFVACSVPGATEVERAAREHLARNKDHPVTPFDPASYTEVLKLAASNLDSFGTYREFAADNEPVPAAGEHLVVTDAWVLLSRPRSNNYLFADLKRLQEKLQSGCEIPTGPLSLVTPSSDQPVAEEPVRFRGLSSRGVPEGGKTQEELYFPLPYNDEQVTIVKYLERAP